MSEAMPVIRYRTRDLTRLLPGTARSMRRMEKITGRSDDMMIVRGVNVFPTRIEEQVLRIHGPAPHFQCVLTRPDRLDELTVRVETREAGTNTANGSNGSDGSELSAEPQRRVKEGIGVTVRVEIVPPHAVERSLGEAKHIVDLRVREVDRGSTERPAGG